MQNDVKIKSKGPHACKYLKMCVNKGDGESINRSGENVASLRSRLRDITIIKLKAFVGISLMQRNVGFVPWNV